ncbi:MAG: dockerin type I domain-containing protein [Lachnospirales bacterium]
MKLKLCTILLTVVMTFLFVSTAYCSIPEQGSFNLPVIGGEIYVYYGYSRLPEPFYEPSYFFHITSANTDNSKDVEEIANLFDTYSSQYPANIEKAIFTVGSFEDSAKLKFVDFSGFNVVSIQENAFKNCTSLRRIIIPPHKDGMPNLTIADNAFDGCDKNKLVISCAPGSEAEIFAKEKGFKYDNNYKDNNYNSLIGDVNMDGKVTAEDASLLMQYVVNKEVQDNTSNIFLMNCDVDVNGKIDSRDVAMILQNALNGYKLEAFNPWKEYI